MVTLGVPGDDVVATVSPFGYHLDEYVEQGRLRRSAFHLADLYRVATRRILAEAIESFRPDVVHTHALSGLSTSALTTPSALGVAHVHTVHDHWLVCERLVRVRRDGTACESICATCAIWSRARRVVVARHRPNLLLVGSRDAATEHTELIAWTRGRTRVVPPPVPDPPHVHGRAPHPSRPPVFGYLGRLEAVKGIRTLLTAFDSTRLGGATLVIGGDGPLRRELEARADPNVRFEGWIDGDRKDAFFADIDCLVVPSECRELAGLVILEARARRLPVIGARIGGIPEFVAVESQPLLFRAGDPIDLFRVLAELVADPGAYVGSAGSAVTTWPEHLDAVLEAYSDARACTRTED